MIILLKWSLIYTQGRRKIMAPKSFVLDLILTPLNQYPVLGGVRDVTSSRLSLPSHVQGLEMITFIIYNPWLQTSFLLISDYLENPVLEVLSKFSTSHNTANIYGSGAGSY